MNYTKWYLSTWFISLCFALWFLFIPLVIGIYLLIMQQKEKQIISKQWTESGFGDTLKIKENITKMENEIGQLENKKENLLSKLKVIDDLVNIKKAIQDNSIENEKLNKQKQKLELEIQKLNNTISLKKDEIVVLDDEILFQSFGFYNPKYNLENSESYKKRLDEIREKQKNMVKSKTATNHFDGWELNGSKKEGQKMNNENIKMTLYSFNNECDNAISKVKFNNLESVEKRIRLSYDKFNKMNEKNRITIKRDYLNLKLEELFLSYEYERKKEEEKEEQRRIKEQMREEEKVRREIESMKLKIEKEEKHFKKEIIALQSRLLSATEQEKINLEKMITELQHKLNLVEKDKENVLEREQNTRAGYVYIISNIGSFGDNIYKIGMTRRLEPMDRVRELGDASVPFKFDVHAMIFSEDAPSLENALHKAFQHRRMNMVNYRKEFFRVSLSEIEQEVRKNFNKVVEFTKLAEAQEYRETLMMSKEFATV